MRRTFVGIAVVGLILTACAQNSSTTAGGSSPGATASAASCQVSSLPLYKPGTLTVATDSPAYWPWFFKNTPSNGQGYESAVAYAVAKQMGFTKDQVTWVVEPFDSSYAPGPKKFDFDINEISYTPQRAKAVTFSDGYFDVTQALVAMKGTKITTANSPSDLKNYEYGDQIGTTGLAYIEQHIQPTKQPAVYDTLNDVKSALQANRIDGFVTDTPTAQYIASSEIKGSTVIGQFPSSGEHIALLFAKGNPLVNCVNKALATLSSNGTLQHLQQVYLKQYLKIPTIQP